MKVGIIGLGKVGIPFALLCKESGLSVVVSDNDEELIYNLNQNVCLTTEPHIQRMLFEQQGISTSDPIEIIKDSDIIFTFIETSLFLDGNIDTSVVFEVANLFFDASKLDIPLYEKKFVISTTTNPGDVEQIQKKLDMFNMQVAYHPVLSEYGEIVSTLKHSDLLLIGANHKHIFDNINKMIDWPDFNIEILRRNPFVHCASMFKKKVWEVVGGFDEIMYDGWEDYDFWLSCAKNGFKFKKCNSTFLYYRQKGIENRDTKAKNKLTSIKEYLKIKHENFYIGDL